MYLLWDIRETLKDHIANCGKSGNDNINRGRRLFKIESLEELEEMESALDDGEYRDEVVRTYIISVYACIKI